MIHIQHTYKWALKSSPLHGQPLRVLGLLQGILQQNDCTSLTLSEGQIHTGVKV